MPVLQLTFLMQDTLTASKVAKPLMCVSGELRKLLSETSLVHEAAAWGYVSPGPKCLSAVIHQQNMFWEDYSSECCVSKKKFDSLGN